VHCIGSREELAALTGTLVDDLHREFVDQLTFTKDGEPGVYRRVPEVLDCWFESGSMPYAQLHYPFENTELFEQGFPAEFIAEGLDQTRGWFYTLTVLGVALFDQPAFRNVIVNGLVLAEDGTKMSKSKRNFTPPDELMERYGADALRLYLINSGLVRAEEQRFADTGVRELTRRALLPWYNAFNFFHTYAELDGFTPVELAEPTAVLDRWILSRLQTLKATVGEEMEGYRLYNVVPRLFEFIEELTNVYIRYNRDRFWTEGPSEDKTAAFSTLYRALLELSQTMAPFAPFLSETLYQRLRDLGDRDALSRSVHLCAYPEAEAARMDPRLEVAVDRMQQVILLGRQKREEARLGLRQPLAKLTVIHRDGALLDDIRALEVELARELNVKEIAYSTDESAFIRLYAKANFKQLGRRLGKEMKRYAAAIAALGPEALEAFVETGTLELEGERFGEGDLEVFREPQPDTEALSNRFITIDLSTELTPTLREEGLAREVVNRIQRARKDADFHVSDRITVRYAAEPTLAVAIEAHGAYIGGETLAVALVPEANLGEDATAVTIDGAELRFTLTREAR
jgi:isoleucyl-tRNA synthetase